MRAVWSDDDVLGFAVKDAGQPVVQLARGVSVGNGELRQQRKVGAAARLCDR